MVNRNPELSELVRVYQCVVHTPPKLEGFVYYQYVASACQWVRPHHGDHRDQYVRERCEVIVEALHFALLTSNKNRLAIYSSTAGISSCVELAAGFDAEIGLRRALIFSGFQAFNLSPC